VTKCHPVAFRLSPRRGCTHRCVPHLLLSGAVCSPSTLCGTVAAPFGVSNVRTYPRATPRSGRGHRSSQALTLTSVASDAPNTGCSPNHIINSSCCSVSGDDAMSNSVEVLATLASASYVPWCHGRGLHATASSQLGTLSCSC